MLEALGVRFIDADGRQITGCCGSKLSAIRRIDTSGLCIDIDECEFVAACDVDTPFVGRDGASNIFARQKGADDKAILRCLHRKKEIHYIPHHTEPES